MSGTVIGPQSEAIEACKKLIRIGEMNTMTWFVAYGFFLGRGYLPTDAEYLASEATDR